MQTPAYLRMIRAVSTPRSCTVRRWAAWARHRRRSRRRLFHLPQRCPNLSLPSSELIGETYQAAGNVSNAADAYGRAAASAGDNSTLAGLLERQASMLESAGRWGDAAAVYDQILSFAVNPGYRTTIGARAGTAYAEAGNDAEAVARWQAVLTEQAPSAAAHPSLAALVERGVVVDLFLRGSINLAAGSTIPAISAFDSFIAENPSDPRVGEALHGIGLAHLDLGNFAEASAFFERVLAEYPSCACFGAVKLDQARLAILSGDDTDGRRLYRTFAREYPSDPLAAEALWRSALSAISADNAIEAAVDFFALVDGFPASERAPRALYVLGIGSMTNKLYTQAILSFSRLQNDYPESTPQAAAYWLGRAYAAQGDAENAAAQWRALIDREPDTYYGVLAGQALLDDSHNTAIFRNVAALSSPASTPAGDDGSQTFAEAWLAERIGVPAATLSTLPADVANDVDLRNGEMLLRLDRRGEALALLQRVANRYDNAHALYALALHFEDLGTYGLAINVSTRLMSMSGARLVEDTPSFIQRIAYPVHFEELVTRESTEFGIDPLLFYSLIRQESLFEEGARSYAAAQGLAQIIPTTGAEIAGRLNFPNYTNALIYRPYINVRFGVFYLDWVRDYVDGSLAAALTGYNAGPGNARTWLDLAGGDETLRVELMTLSEPRLYVQRILSHYYHYNRLYR
ncbi:MAG: tetratricopeptide repeat protein [Caldilineaceae bacterium]